MYKYKHTVFTLVYNRAHLIGNVYSSLCNQDYPKKDFEWLIIDDGSTDGLKEVVDGFINSGEVNIRYIYKSNGGIHTAVNCAIKNALGEYVTRIDSDDVLCPDALANKDKALSSIPSDQFDKYVGVVGLCLNKSDLTVRGSKFPYDVMDTTGLEMRKKYNVKGDKNFCMKTEIMKKFPIPEYYDTKYVPEGVMWNRIDREYITRFINVGLSICAEASDDSMMKSISSNEKSKEAYLSIFYSDLNNLNEAYDYMSVKEYIGKTVRLLSYGKLSKQYRFREVLKLLTLRKNVIVAVLLLPIAQMLVKYKQWSRSR